VIAWPIVHRNYRLKGNWNQSHGTPDERTRQRPLLAAAESTKVGAKYSPEGKVVWNFKKPDEPKGLHALHAISRRMAHADHAQQRKHRGGGDPAAKIVWQLSNAILPTPMLQSPVAHKRLANGTP